MKIKMPNGWRTIKSLVHKIRLHGRRGKGMAESFSREKLRQAPQKEGGWKILWLTSSCVTPAGTSIEVQNEWEENTHTTRCHAFRYGRQNKNPALTRIQLTTSALLAGVRGYLLDHSGRLQLRTRGSGARRRNKRRNVSWQNKSLQRKARAGLRHAVVVVCPNVTRNTNERIA